MRKIEAIPLERDVTDVPKHPDELTTFEFINRHLYQRALKGAYRNELELVKERLSPSLDSFKDAEEFMKAMRKDHDLKEKTVRELKQLWKKDYDLRPATGVILMLALWINAPAASENYWYKLFVGLEEGGEA